MSDDEFMKELKAVAKEELDKQILPGDALLEQLVDGTISDADLKTLQSMAAEDESVAVAIQAFTPLGDKFEDNLTDKLLAMVGAEEPELSKEPARVLNLEEKKPSFFEWIQNLFQFENPAFGPALAGAAAMAMVAVFYPGTDSPLGRYNMEISQGDALVRGKTEVAQGTPTYAMGSLVQIILRPDTGGDDELQVRTYLASENEFTQLNIPTQVSATGAVRISGEAGQAFPARDKPYDVVTVLSRFNDTPDEATVRQAVQAGIQAQGEHWQILTTKIHIQ